MFSIEFLLIALLILVVAVACIVLYSKNKLGETVRNGLHQVRRVLPDVALFSIVGYVLLMGLYKFLPAPVQVVMMKALLVSCGFLHAHITRKIAFPAIDWDSDSNSDDGMKRLLVVVLYAVIIYAYAHGG